MKMNDVILFCIFHVIKVEHEFVSIITAEHDIESIVNEINVNHDLKGAVKTVVKSFHIELPINLAEVPVIYIKLLLELKSDMMKDQLVKEFR